MLIQVDVDSTLYDADKLFQEVANSYGIEWIPRSPHWFDPKDINTDLVTLKKIFRVAHSREYVMKQEPYEDAAAVLLYLSKLRDDIEIAYVSDCNVQQTGALSEWLEHHGFLLADEVEVQITKDKRHWMREHRPEIVIDDRVRTLLFARYELGSYAVALQQPHNVNLKGEANGIYVAKDWKEIGEIVPNLIDTLLPISRTQEMELMSNE